MKGELLYTKNPRHFQIIWGLVYLFVVVALFVGLYVAANHIRTQTLPIGGVQLSIPYSKYVTGETVTFTIKNNFNGPIYVTNNCPAEPLNVYRQEGSKWVQIHEQASPGTCPDEQRQVSIPAMGSSNGSYAAWPNLFSKPGKYRIVAYIENYNALPYQEIEVIAKPAPAVKQPVQTLPTTAQPINNSTQPTGGTFEELSPGTNTGLGDN